MKTSPVRAKELQTMTYPEYLKTPEWRSIRDKRVRFARNRCEVCNASKHLHVHHRTYERRGAERMTDVVALCERCHNLFHEHTIKAGTVWHSKGTAKAERIQRHKDRQKPKARRVKEPSQKPKDPPPVPRMKPRLIKASKLLADVDAAFERAAE